MILHTEQQKWKYESDFGQNRQKYLTISVGANLRWYFTSDFFPHGKINLSGTFRGEMTLVGGNIPLSWTTIYLAATPFIVYPAFTGIIFYISKYLYSYLLSADIQAIVKIYYLWRVWSLFIQVKWIEGGRGGQSFSWEFFPDKICWYQSYLYQGNEILVPGWGTKFIRNKIPPLWVGINLLDLKVLV